MNYVSAINNALFLSMQNDDKVICYGLGVPDPKNIFGTTAYLQKAFGEKRVFDMPLSENAMTGVAIGAAIRGYKPIMVHQRFDFFLLAMDQLVNGAAKWHMMFGGQVSLPITIRLIVGRGWGQGPTHSQSLHAWLAHIPGLKVVMPSSPSDAKGLLMESIRDPNPVIYIEHRWLHNMEGTVPSGDFFIPLGEAKVIESGRDLTIVGTSIFVPEAIRAIKYLNKENINAELIDLRTVRPIDYDTIIQSVRKTKRLLVLDIGAKTGSIAGEIIAEVASSIGNSLISNPERICLPDFSVPTSFGLTKDFYPDFRSIVCKVYEMLNLEPNSPILKLKNKVPHDVPGDWFDGPF